MPENPNAGHRARMMARFEMEGMSLVNFHTHEALEMFLFLLIPRVNTNHTAHLLIDRFGSLYNVFHAQPEELAEIRGISVKSAEAINLFGAIFDHAGESELMSSAENIQK